MKTIENLWGLLLGSVSAIWIIATSGGIRQEWATPNCWKQGEEEEEEYV